MSGDAEFRCFVGGLSWSTSDRDLKDAFEKFGHLLEAKVVLDKASGRSRGFGFVTFGEKQAMEEAIDAMNGLDLDGRTINVDRAKPQQGGGRDFDNDRSRDRDRRDRGREYGGGRGTGDGGCFNCGKSGHFARECPSEGARGGRDGGREDRYGGGGDGGREDRYGGGGGGRYGPDRAGIDMEGVTEIVVVVKVVTDTAVTVLGRMIAAEDSDPVATDCGCSCMTQKSYGGVSVLNGSNFRKCETWV